VSETDIAVVGAGILGLAVARELGRRDPGRRVVVLEREDRVATHQTARNSGVVHAGIYYAPGSLKARLCVAGMRELAAYCESRGLAYERCGKLIVALDRGELPALDELQRRGEANGVAGLRRLDAAELRRIEPHAAGVAALHSPETAIVDFAAVARALADDVREAGGEIVVGAAVAGVEVRAEGGRPSTSTTRTDGPSKGSRSGGSSEDSRAGAPSADAGASPAGAPSADAGASPAGAPSADAGASPAGAPSADAGASPADVGAASTRRIVLRHSRGELVAGFAVFCAGAWSDRLAELAGAGADPRIVPFRGAYLRLVPGRRELVRGLIYPVPDPRLPFLGVHLTRHIGGDVLIGPTALLAPVGLGRSLSWPGTWRMARRWWRTGVTELHHALSPAALTRAAARYVPDLAPGDAEPAWAGVRAQALARDGTLLDDFAFSHTERALHVRNAPSPAATAALAIARHVADQVERAL
jgi:L-2-hydroxyglutarate oxidase